MIKKQKVLFLDRDGTICVDDGAFCDETFEYSEILKRIRPVDGAYDALKIAKEKGYILVVISNQAGIAKGRFEECDTHIANQILQEKFDGMIDGFYYCPHHTTGFNNNGKLSKNARIDLIGECDCRKPKIGMFLQCENDLRQGKLQYIDSDIIKNKTSYEYDRSKIYKKDVEPMLVDKENSFMVGDKWIDILAGERYGVKPIFVMTGEGYVEFHNKKDKQVELPHLYYFFDNIGDFVSNML